MRCLVFACCVIATPAWAQTPRADLTALKARILVLAEKAAAKGPDAPDLRKQAEALVKQLVAADPQPPVAQRMGQIYGNWCTVLPPDDKPGNMRKTARIDERRALQVVSAKGYFYNLIPMTDTTHPDRSKLGLLRAAYRPVAGDPNGLSVDYQHIVACQACLADRNPYRFAGQAESQTLPDSENILPDFLLGLVIKDGVIDEVYSDGDIRIGYGVANRQTGHRALYVLKRAD